MRASIGQIAQAVVLLALILGFLAYVGGEADDAETVIAAATRPVPNMEAEDLDPNHLRVPTRADVAPRERELEHELLVQPGGAGRTLPCWPRPPDTE